MTAGVVVLVLTVLAVATVTVGPRLWHFCTVWSRLTTIATTFGAYDSKRQAGSATHPTSGIRPRPPERGHVRPLLREGWDHGLPRCWVIYGKTVPPKANFAEFCAEAEHYSDLAWTLTRRRRGRSLELRQAPPSPAALPMPRVEVAAIGWWDQFPIGTSHHGPVWWNPADDETANLLAAARPGWGKSHLVGNLLDHADAARGRWRVYVLDPEDDIEVDGHPCVHGVGFDAQAQLAALHAVQDEFAERTRLHERGTTWAQVIARRGRVLVVYDEFPSIMAPPARSAVDYEPRRQSQALIATFLSRGRKRGIHGVALTWDPRAKALGGEIRSAFGARLAGWLDPAEYPLVLRRPVPRTLTGHGHGWWCAKEADPVEVQTYDRVNRAQSHARPAPPSEEAPTTTVHRPFGAIGARKWGR